MDDMEIINRLAERVKAALEPLGIIAAGALPASYRQRHGRPCPDRCIDF
jgi:hypothetical protein